MSQGDVESALGCCRRFGGQEPHLWVELLWGPPPPHHLPEVLNVIGKIISLILLKAGKIATHRLDTGTHSSETDITYGFGIFMFNIPSDEIMIYTIV